MKQICKDLKNFREERNLTQEELADILRVVRQTIAAWEGGLVSPSREVMLRAFLTTYPDVEKEQS